MEFMESKINKVIEEKPSKTVFETTKEPVFLSEVIYDGQVEQGVEFDYVLPDYYPDIFKVLKSTLTPSIISYNVSGNQLYFDGVVYIKVLYLSRESNQVHTIEHRYTYSKTLELSKNVEETIVNIASKTDYCNCRAVSGRRIDVRGAVSSKIKVSSTKETDMITGANGMGVETRKTSLDYCGEKLIASRQFVTREDIETGVGSGGISSIVHHDTSVVVTEHKVIADKVIIKGEATVRALYLRKIADEFNNNSNLDTDYAHSDNSNSSDILGKNEGENESENNNSNAPLPPAETAEIMEAVIPISQIIDLHGVTEEHICFVNLSVLDCDLELKSHSGDYDDNANISNSYSDNDDGYDTDGSSRTFACDLTVNCTVTAHLEKKVMPLVDMYSVEFESSFSKTTIKTESMPRLLERQLNLKSTIECSDGELESVHDARCGISNVSCRVKTNNFENVSSENTEKNENAEVSDNISGELIISGQANLQIMGRLVGGSPVFVEKVEQFELVSEVEGLTKEHVIDPNLQVINTTYSISAENRVEIRVTLKLNGALYQMRSIQVIKDISINAEKPKTRNNEYALKLYYAEKNENVWHIAKRYNTSAEAIITENDMEHEKVTTPCMLLIPIV